MPKVMAAAGVVTPVYASPCVRGNLVRPYCGQLAPMATGLPRARSRPAAGRAAPRRPSGRRPTGPARARHGRRAGPGPPDGSLRGVGRPARCLAGLGATRRGGRPVGSGTGRARRRGHRPGPAPRRVRAAADRPGGARRGRHLVAPERSGGLGGPRGRAGRVRLAGLGDPVPAARLGAGGSCATRTANAPGGRLVIGWGAILLGVARLVHVAHGTPQPAGRRQPMRAAGGWLGWLSSAPLVAGVTAYVAVPLLLLLVGFGVLVLTATPVHAVPGAAARAGGAPAAPPARGAGRADRTCST